MSYLDNWAHGRDLLDHDSWAQHALETRILFELEKKQPRHVALATGTHAISRALPNVCPNAHVYTVGVKGGADWGDPDVIVALDYLGRHFLELARDSMRRWSILYLAATLEDDDVAFTDDELMKDIADHGLVCWHRWNVSASPQIAKKLRMEKQLRGYGNPPALVDAHALPIATYQDPVPGRVLYLVGKR